MARIARIAFFVALGAFSICIALFATLFLFRLAETYRAPVSFDAPGGAWTLTLKETKFSDAFFQKAATLDVHKGAMRGHQLLCRMDQTHADRELFNQIRSVQWRDNDLKMDYEAGTPPVGGTVDIAEACADIAVFDDKPARVSLRFYETCIVPQCARWVEWRDTIGNEIFAARCGTTATGDSPVFTSPGDALGQVDVQLHAGERRATWRSRRTGQFGEIVFATDCDRASQRRYPQPS